MRPLTDEELAHFKEAGYVIVKGVLEDADFEGALQTLVLRSSVAV